MKFISNPKYWITPDINGNLKLPENERLSIEIIRPTAENAGELAKVSAVRKNDGSIQMDTKFEVSQILKNHVGQIKNLVIEEGSGDKTVSKTIKNGLELCDAVFYGSKELVNIICNEVVSDRLSDAEKKSLK